MLALLLRKRNFENDILLKLSAPDTDPFEVRLPGALKSSRRNPFHLQPGAVLEAEVKLPTPGSIRPVPREINVIQSPFDEEASYDDLTCIADVIACLETERPLSNGSFSAYREFLKMWNSLDRILRPQLTHRFCLKVLHNAGFLGRLPGCENCLSPGSFFLPGKGEVCSDCDIVKSHDMIPLIPQDEESAAKGHKIREQLLKLIRG